MIITKKLFYQIFTKATYGIILIAVFSIFDYYFTKTFGGVGFYLLIFIPVIIVLLNLKNMKFNKYSKKQFFAFMTWACIYIINLQFIQNYAYSNIFLGIDFNIFTLQTIQVICVVLIYLYIASNKFEIMKNTIIKIILFSLIMDAVITINALSIDSNISKIMATGISELNTPDSKGASGYSIIYSIVIILPLFYYSYLKHNGVKRIMSLLYVIIMISLIYKSAYFTANVAVILGFLIFIFLNTSRRLKVILIPVIMVIGIYSINAKAIYDTFMMLSDKIDIFQISQRLEQLANLAYYNDNSGAALCRFELYRKSIDAFIKSPLVGIHAFNQDYDMSGHSALLDILGSTGIIGFVPYILFIWYSYKNCIVNTYEKQLINAIRTSFTIFLFIASLNTLATSMTIMLVFLYFNKFFPCYINKTILKSNLKKEGATYELS